MTMPTSWTDEAFFSVPERDSIDGGTTSAGDLWHAVSPRWGHSMHTMCSYQGMFPAKVAHYFIQRYSKVGDVVLDPFSGRGTTALQARAEGRHAIANDLSPLAFVLTGAKVNPPSWVAINAFLDDLERTYKRSTKTEAPVSEDIRMLYHDNTLSQIVFLRDRLLTKTITEWSPEELMMGGALAGIMHGAWRRDNTSQYLSISMPNTFSMSPTYVKKFILENGLEKLDQNVFERLRDKFARLYLDDDSGHAGAAFHSDAAALLKGQSLKPNSVDLVLTSPPYLQVMNYGTANWIRLWLLGLDEVGRDQGVGRKKLDADLDHRHNFDSYKHFMLRTVQGIERVLTPNGVAVLVIGDVADPGKDARPLAAQIWNQISDRTELRLEEMVEDDLPVQNKVSRIWGETKGKATTRDCALVITRKGVKPILGNTEVGWDEPYKDGGPDAAHERMRRSRLAS